MKKLLSLTLCIVMLISLALSLASCKEKNETEIYEYRSMKVESVTVGGQDYTEQLGDALREEFDEDDMKGARIEITGKEISFKDDDDDNDEKDRTYAYTLNGDEIVCENLKDDFAKEFTEGSKFKNVDFAFFKKGTAIEMKMDITVEESGMEIKVIMTYVFERK